AGDDSVGSRHSEGGGELFGWLSADIERHFATDRTVASYASRLGYSTRTLNRAALAHAGVTAKELIDRRVVLEAKRRLAHERVPVAEIAESLGFADPSNFSAFFTARVGRTPLTFRVDSRSEVARQGGE
ncbi:MAG: AraC family transcriptional regulator, partial [Micropruina sp.]